MVDSISNGTEELQDKRKQHTTLSAPVLNLQVLVRDFKELEKERYNEENLITVTSEDQIQVEWNVHSLFSNYSCRQELDCSLPKLARSEHIHFLKKSLEYLPSGYQSLDASRPWLCYWILHCLSLLEVKLPTYMKDNIADFLGRCQCPDGGFGGGPGQLAHIATTYAAVNSLCILGTKKSYETVNRETLYKFLWDVRSSDGAFSMHRGGEVDIRGVYCALSIATLTNIQNEHLFEGSAEWVVSCQTYEGGFSGYPGLEAHGGYSFCGLSALTMLNKSHLCDIQAFLRWSVNRQMRYEGGFQGRTNKLVDGCYSFWQGGGFTLIHSLLAKDNVPPREILFNQSALQEYILLCCQHPNGGLIDKPGKPRDIYHTCYSISGLSVAQHSPNYHTIDIGNNPSNIVVRTHPIYNIVPDIVLRAISYYSRLNVPPSL